MAAERNNEINSNDLLISVDSGVVSQQRLWTDYEK
jgi:hypothetical protein